MKNFVKIVPEFSYLTGITDAIRKDFTIMKSIANYSKKNAADKVNTIKDFAKAVNNREEPQQIMKSWCCNLDTNPFTFNAH